MAQVIHLSCSETVLDKFITAMCPHPAKMLFLRLWRNPSACTGGSYEKEMVMWNLLLTVILLRASVRASEHGGLTLRMNILIPH